MHPEYPCLHIDLSKLAHNSSVLCGRCQSLGITLAGVVKCCCGSPEVARAFIRGGVRQIADSRVANLRRLRESGITTPLWLLRLPMPSEIPSVVRHTDLSLNSSPEVLELLSQEALRQRKIHQVLLMVDLGDRREGILPGEVLQTVRMIQKLSGLYFAGVGTNLTCFGGIVPDHENMSVLAETVRQIRQDLHHPVPWVSAGNSSSLTWALEGKMPPEVNHLRLGESLLLGNETADGAALPGTDPDAFNLEAEIIEAAIKPSLPKGIAHLDAFGRKPHYEDRGIRRRIILGIGREDVIPEGLVPLEPGIEILGASSDHLICDAGGTDRPLHPGDHLRFRMNYGALLAAMTSPYVSKNYLDKQPPEHARLLDLIGYTEVADEINGRARGSAESLLRCKDNLKAASCRTASSLSDLRMHLRSTLSSRHFPIIISGDSTCLAALDQIAGKGLILFSAFGDFNTQSSPGGTLCGRSLAALCGRHCGSELSNSSPFPESGIVHIGLRSTDFSERRELRSSAIKIYTMEQLDLLGIREILYRSLQHLEDFPEILVGLSLSVLDPREFSGAVQTVSAGFSLRELYCALELLADSGRLGGVLIYDFINSPSAVSMAEELLSTLLGKKII